MRDGKRCMGEIKDQVTQGSYVTCMSFREGPKMKMLLFGFPINSKDDGVLNLI